MIMVSEIQGSNSGVVQGTDNRNAQLNAKKVDDANKAEATAAPAASSSVNVTQAASSLQALEKSIAAAPEVDQQKVDAVRKAINEGTYKVDSEQTASKLIGFDTALPKS